MTCNQWYHTDRRALANLLRLETCQTTQFLSIPAAVANNCQESHVVTWKTAESLRNLNSGAGLWAS